MEAAIVVIPLVGLVFPIVMLLAALFADAGITIWVIYRLRHPGHARMI